MSTNRLITFFLMVAFAAAAQSDPQESLATIPPSPGAMSMMKLAAIPVSQYTGTAQVSVPLWQLSGRGISIPVDLLYQASGIKVQDVSGPVGLGWTLNAGGLITRVVRGRPDGLVYNCDQIDDYLSAVSRNCDPEADMFFYSFLGRTGRMYLTENGTPATMPYQDLSITPGVGAQSTDGVWKMKDERGYVYYFGETNDSREESVAKDFSVQPTDRSYVATWHLSKITSPEGFVVATFVYESGPDLAIPYYSMRKVFVPNVNSNEVSITDVVETKFPKYIKRIATALGEVAFTYMSTKFTVTPRALQRITIANTTGVVKSFNLVYGAFRDELDSVDMALRLDKIAEGPVAASAFYRIFEYQTNYVVGRYSIYEDHWGYYNRHDTDARLSKLPGVTLSCVPTYSCSILYKDPDGERVKMALLNKVIYATGGSTELFYSAKGGGGVKVDTIRDSDGSGNVVAKRVYTYLNEFVFGTPTYYYALYSEPATVQVLVVSSTSFTELFDLNGASSGFSKVIETNLDVSRTETSFTNYGDNPDDPPLNYVCINPPYQSCTESQYPAAGNFVPRTTKFWLRGLTELVEHFDSEGNIILVVIPEITPVAVPLLTRQSFSAVTRDTGYPYTFYKSTYELYSMALQTTRTIRRTYMYDQGTSSFVEEITTNTHHPIHKTIPSVVKNTRSGGQSTKVTFRFPSDITTGTPTPADPESEGMWCLTTANVIVPIETINYFNEPGEVPKIVDASIVTYRKSQLSPSSKHVLPFKSYQLRIGDPITALSSPLSIHSSGDYLVMDPNYRLMSTTTWSDMTGSISSTIGVDGVPTSYEWDYGGSIVKKITANPGVSEQSISFTSDSQLGLTSKTDANSKVESYSYDRKGRLKLVRDFNGDIVSRHRYHYRNEFENAADFSVVFDGCTAALVVTDPIESGSRLIWDFGDGSTKENGFTTETHTYVPGQYEIKLAVVHPEFSTGIACKAIKIYPPPTIAITSPQLPPSPTICPSSNPSLMLSLSASATPPLGVTYYYTWEYMGSGGWVTFGSKEENSTKQFSPTLLFSPGSTKLIRCKVTDVDGAFSCYSNAITIFIACQGGGAGGQENCVNPGCYWDGTQCNCSTSCPEGYFWDGFQCVAY